MSTLEERADGRRRMHELVEKTREVGLRTAGGSWSSPADALMKVLYEYAVAALQTMMKDGSIQSQGPAHLRFLHIDEGSLEWLRIDHESRHYLASELIIKTFPKFLEKAVEGGGWNSTRSALPTYFVNACLMNKHDVINKWAKETRRNRAAWSEEQPADRALPDIADNTVNRVELSHLIGISPASVRPILVALSHGFTVADAARGMRISVGAAEKRLARYRANTIIPRVAEGLLGAPSNYFVTNHVAAAIAANDADTYHESATSGPFDNSWPPAPDTNADPF
ncbi:hypothetical protein ACLBYD_28695 [Rhodococcus sp. C26F]